MQVRDRIFLENSGFLNAPFERLKDPHAKVTTVNETSIIWNYVAIISMLAFLRAILVILMWFGMRLRRNMRIQKQKDSALNILVITPRKYVMASAGNGPGGIHNGRNRMCLAS